MSARVIGLTGPIGAGKSLVASMLRELGAKVIDADAIVHDEQSRGTVGYSALSQRNEKLAQELLEEHRQLLREFLPHFHGTGFKTIGDA